MKNEFTVKELIPFAPKNTTRNNGYKHWISIGITYKKLKNKVKFKVNAGDKVNNIELHHTVTNNELHKLRELRDGLRELREIRDGLRELRGFTHGLREFKNFTHGLRELRGFNLIIFNCIIKFYFISYN